MKTSDHSVPDRLFGQRVIMTSRECKKRGRSVLIAITCAVLAIAPSPAMASSSLTLGPAHQPGSRTASDIETIDTLCGLANSLNYQERPEEALDLIEQVTSKYDIADGPLRMDGAAAECFEAARLTALHQLANAPVASAPPRPQPEPTFTPVAVSDLCDDAIALALEGHGHEAIDLIDEVSSKYTGEGAGLTMAPQDASCMERARLLALDALTEETRTGLEDLSAPQNFAAAWKTGFERWISPWSAPILGALAIFGGLLVVARVIALFRWAPFRNPEPSRVTHLIWISAGLAFLSSVVFVAALPTYRDGDVTFGGWLSGLHLLPWFWLISSVAVAFVSTIILGRALASRLRIQIQVHKESGEPDAAATSQLVAHLWDLGGHPPEGFEVPVGTDVQILKETSLVLPPEQKVIAFMFKVVEALAGATPWKATVDVAPGGVLSIQISRGGWTLKSLVARPGNYLGLPTKLIAASTDEKMSTQALEPDMKKLAAAAILVTLSTKYQGFADGLAQATNWESVGLQYIATSDFKSSDIDAIPILESALDLDPNNRLARLALRHHEHRFDTDAPNLRHYAAWLRTEYHDVWLKSSISHDAWRSAVDPETPVPYLNLKRRLLFNYAIAVVNLRSIAGSDSEEPEAETLTEELADLLEVKEPNSDTLAQEMLISSRMTRAFMDGKDPELIFHSAIYARRDAYNMACFLALRAAVAGPQPRPSESDPLRNDPADRRRRAVDYLKQAIDLPGVRDWAKRDPSLRSLRGVEGFDELVGFAPRTSYWDLEPFSSLRSQLEAEGIPEPSEYAKLATAQADLKTALKISGHLSRRLIRISQLMEAANAAAAAADDPSEVERHAATAAGENDRRDAQQAPKTYKVELVAAAISRGIDSRPSPSDLSRLAKEITKTILERAGKLEISKKGIQHWQDQVEKWLEELPGDGHIRPS